MVVANVIAELVKGRSCWRWKVVPGASLEVSVSACGDRERFEFRMAAARSLLAAGGEHKRTSKDDVAAVVVNFGVVARAAQHRFATDVALAFARTTLLKPVPLDVLVPYLAASCKKVLLLNISG
jgi:hypothetical protein